MFSVYNAELTPAIIHPVRPRGTTAAKPKPYPWTAPGALALSTGAVTLVGFSSVWSPLSLKCFLRPKRLSSTVQWDGVADGSEIQAGNAGYDGLKHPHASVLLAGAHGAPCPVFIYLFIFLFQYSHLIAIS